MLVFGAVNREGFMDASIKNLLTIELVVRLNNQSYFSFSITLLRNPLHKARLNGRTNPRGEV